MPMSSAEGKPWTRERISQLARRGPLTVLDVGPGVGTYAKLLSGLPIERMLAIEAWAPYLETYRLREYYDDIVVGDVRHTDLPPCDVVILGDVVEHMTRAEGLDLWRRSADAARRAVYLSIPIVHYPQDEIEGNPFEVHVEEDWTDGLVLDHFPGIGERWRGSEVGVYERLTG